LFIKKLAFDGFYPGLNFNYLLFVQKNNKILLFIKKLAFDGFYPLLVVLKKSIFVVV